MWSSKPPWDDPRWQHPSRHLNFSFVIKEKLAGSARPSIDVDLVFLKENKIRALVAAWERGLGPSKKKVEKSGLDFLRTPVCDFHAPSIEQIREALSFIDSALSESKPVAVACGFGEGRTGVFLSCYLISAGLNLDNALTRMLELRRIPYENGEQLRTIQEYAASVRRG